MNHCVVDCPNCSVKLRFPSQANSESTVLLCPKCSGQFLARQSIGQFATDIFSVDARKSSAVSYTTTPPALGKPLNIRWIMFVVGVTGVAGVCLLVSLMTFIGSNMNASTSVAQAASIQHRNTSTRPDLNDLQEKTRKSLEAMRNRTGKAEHDSPQSQPATTQIPPAVAPTPKREMPSSPSPKPPSSDSKTSLSQSGVPTAEVPPSLPVQPPISPSPTGRISLGGIPLPGRVGQPGRNMPDTPTQTRPPFPNPSVNQPLSPYAPSSPSFTPPDSSLKEFEGPKGVRVYVTNASQLDAKKTSEQLTKGLTVPGKTWFASGDSFAMGLRYSGPLSDIVHNVDFGDVIEVDESNRIIRIKARGR